MIPDAPRSIALDRARLADFDPGAGVAAGGFGGRSPAEEGDTLTPTECTSTD